MKVAFDENVPLAMVRVFQLFQNERQLQSLSRGLEIVKAQDYYPSESDPDYRRKNDAPWIRRYKAAGGNVIISGDKKMMEVAHERLALVEEGMVVFFFQRQWSGWEFHSKCALLMHWWPKIIDKAKKARAPKFYIVPSSWAFDGKLKNVSTKDQKLVRIQRQIAAGPKIAAKRKAQREAEEKAPEFDFGMPNEPKKSKPRRSSKPAVAG